MKFVLFKNKLIPINTTEYSVLDMNIDYNKIPMSKQQLIKDIFNYQRNLDISIDAICKLLDIEKDDYDYKEFIELIEYVIGYTIEKYGDIK